MYSSALLVANNAHATNAETDTSDILAEDSKKETVLVEVQLASFVCLLQLIKLNPQAQTPEERVDLKNEMHSEVVQPSQLHWQAELLVQGFF